MSTSKSGWNRILLACFLECREVWSATSSSTPGGNMSTSSPVHLRAGLHVSQASVAWSVTVCAAAVVTGVIDGGLVLIAFGLTGLLDGAGSFVLALHFRHALAH